MKPEDVPPGIKVKRQKTILRFESIKEYDMYSAFFYAQTIASNVVDAYGFLGIVIAKLEPTDRLLPRIRA